MGKVVKVVATVAVAVAIVALAAPTGGLSLGLAGALGVSTAVASALVATGLSLVAGLAMKVLFKPPKVGAPTNEAGTPTVYRQTITDSNIVYGQRRVGGLLTFFHARKSGSDYYRYFVISIAGHRVKGVLRWFLGDEEVTVNSGGLVTSGVYANAAWLWFDRGEASSAANATFVSECDGRWTTAHRGRGVAKFYAKFKMTDAVVQSGMPNMTCEIEGRDEIADPRLGTTGYTNNATLVFYDWMALPREEGGFGAYPDEIPDASYIAANANVCDEDVPIAGGTEKRYALDGIIVTGAAPADVRDALVANCAGTYATVGGKFLMRPGYYVAPSATLLEKDLAGPIKVSPFLPGFSTATEIQGTFSDPANLYQPQPLSTVSIESTDVRQADLDLAFVRSKARGERIAKIMLKRAQAEKTVVWPMNIVGLGVQAMDTVQLATSRYGLSNYAWSVTSWRMSVDFGVVLGLREENPEIYDEDGSEGAPGGTVGAIGVTDPIRTFEGLSVAATRYAIAIACASDGTPKAGQLPQTVDLYLYDGATDVHEVATYAVAATDCSASVSNSAGTRGRVTITAIGADIARADVTATYLGRDIVQRIGLTKVKDGADGSSDGGYPPIEIAFGTTDYATPIVLDAGESIPLAALFIAASGSGSGMATIQVQAGLLGSGSWTVIGSESSSFSPSEPIGISAGGTMTNLDSVRRSYAVRAVVSKTGGAIGATDRSQSRLVIG